MEWLAAWFLECRRLYLHKVELLEISGQTVSALSETVLLCVGLIEALILSHRFHLKLRHELMSFSFT